MKPKHLIFVLLTGILADMSVNLLFMTYLGRTNFYKFLSQMWMPQVVSLTIGLVVLMSAAGYFIYRLLTLRRSADELSTLREKALVLLRAADLLTVLSKVPNKEEFEKVTKNFPSPPWHPGLKAYQGRDKVFIEKRLRRVTYKIAEYIN